MMSQSAQLGGQKGENSPFRAIKKYAYCVLLYIFVNKQL